MARRMPTTKKKDYGNAKKEGMPIAVLIYRGWQSAIKNERNERKGAQNRKKDNETFSFHPIINSRTTSTILSISKTSTYSYWPWQL